MPLSAQDSHHAAGVAQKRRNQTSNVPVPPVTRKDAAIIVS
jgi:hypothetical protein